MFVARTYRAKPARNCLGFESNASNSSLQFSTTPPLPPSCPSSRTSSASHSLVSLLASASLASSAAPSWRVRPAVLSLRVPPTNAVTSCLTSLWSIDNLNLHLLAATNATITLPTPRIDPIGHAIAMATFGFAGYWAYQWDQRAAVLLAEKRAQIAERRGNAESAPSS